MSRTQNEAVAFARSKVGTAENYDGRYGAQCWDLIMFYAKWLGLGMPPAVEGAGEWANKQWASGFAKVTDPQPGDIAIFGAISTNKWGHAAIVVERPNQNEFISVDYNWVNSSENGSPGALVRHAVNNPKRTMTYIRPAFTVTQPQAQSPVVGSNQYQIKNGDTFWAIEAANGWTHGTLQSLNPSLDPKKLKIGQVINLPTSTHSNPQPQPAPQQRKYTVVKGDTLWQIAEKTGIGGANYMAIYNLNKGVIGGNPNEIKPGQVLVLP